MEKMEFKSKDIVSYNVEKISNLFPNVVSEGKINFEKLRQELINDLIEGDESYDFTWVGKKNSVIEANTPTTKTLRPCIEESENFDSTENLYIEGDNLEVLKILQKSYFGKIKCIYIDPPYNTGNDFIYNDDFKMDSDEYKVKSGEIDDEGNRLFKNTDSNGRFHSDWCSMIYSRLKLAYNLLSDDGVIFISIDDNEVDNLRKICDEIFGQNNFVAIFSWMKTATPPSLSINIRRKLEMLLLYKKSYKGNGLNGGIVEGGDMPLLNESNAIRELVIKNSAIVCKIPDGIYEPGEYDRIILLKKFVVKDGKAITDLYIKGPFKWTQETLDEETRKLTTYYIKSEKFAVRYCRTGERIKLPSNLISKDECGVGTNEDGAKEIKSLFNDIKVFDFPKPVSLIKYVVNMKVEKNDIILDFFSGSSTTAHAVMKLNVEDGSNRKFIMVQLPEETSEDSEAYKAGYKNICEIGKERIRRAGKKILEENKDKEGIKNLDTGFRVLKLSDSNMKEVYYNPDDYSQDLISQLTSNIKEDRNEDDLLFASLLDRGIDISKSYRKVDIDGNKVIIYNEEGEVPEFIACFDENITEKCVTEIAKMKPLKATFRDSSFGSSSDRINVEEIFKLYSKDTRVSVM